MTYHHFAPLDRDLSRLVLGPMVFSLDALDNTFALMDAWLEAGGNIVDLAHVYAGGNSERALGRWLKTRGSRDSLVILDKGAHHNQDRRRVTPDDIGSDLRDSLARLGVETIDIYVLHRDDPDVPVGEIVDALNTQVRAGRIRCFGGSNWTTDRLDAANAYARAHGLQGMSVSSPNLSLAVQNEPIWDGCVLATDPASRAWYTRTQMPLFAWSSQARGFFTGRFREGDGQANDVARVYYTAENWERLRRAEQLGAERGFTANELALAWVLQQPFPTFPLIGPASVQELKSSLRALDVNLSEREAHWLNLEADR
jgi:aryl-alcohol dehydrogenase-like predicted oxidoreductase